jgi:uncharacterized circularly permuted ATP-grasp superfamily protein
MKDLLQSYQSDGFYDEVFFPSGDVRPAYRSFINDLQAISLDELRAKQHAAERTYIARGITFNVYSEGEGVERTMPFDLLPRIVSAEEWSGIERGLIQRVRALDAFLDDVYGKKLVIKDKVVPQEIIESSSGYLKACEGIHPPRNRWVNISGIDLIRHSDGHYYVLEDNCRVPSGVSYVLENREIMKRVFPGVFERTHVCPVNTYPLRLLEMLEYLSDVPEPNVVVLTPGIYNSAYFEHSFLAQQMGVELVEGRDLVVDNGVCCMRTTRGLKQVDVIYRRVDDESLDPQVFRSDSLLGVPGLFDVYRKGRVVLANAPGTGVADDKVICAFVPDMIRYYLHEDPVLPNVPTYLCWRPQEREHVIANIEKMVVKESGQSGGYGMLVGSASTRAQQEDFIGKIRKDPRNYIAQPIMALSRVPTLIGNGLEGRHVDLRPFILFGKEPLVLSGGLTRVALCKGSLVVNSSQGGGSKDTWVLSNAEGSVDHA